MKKRLKALFYGILAAFLLFGIYEKNRNPAVIETFSVDSLTEEEITDELIIALFMEEITKEVTNFYKEFYSGELMVYLYETEITDIAKKEPGKILVTFGVTPQIGAHNPLGYDELSYSVDSMGNKELADYRHLKNYEVPERFRKYLIKPLQD
ncbi:MAG: DUF3888 domain-containing protein [Bacteroidales bacterium]|nr:DUF3888 domain-containing protein [Lachnoclostridium sp.]MCM1384068.1 DUF3888 domain-containing protein [Lachnoclostridium sp.]MCM1465458.1 DUF3888 domain-containing protein [Bacteroidales bacterium]